MRSFPWDSLVIGKDKQYGFPIIDRPSSAESLREVYKTFFSNGVFLNDRDAFQVTPSDGMNVIVAAGKCGIEGTIGWEEFSRALAVQASSDTADRIDTVVLRWNANISVRNIDLYVKTGVPQEVPVRPTLTRNETVWELGIADIFVAKGTGAISQARITDTRLQTERCGAVTPFATIDTTTFYNQIQAAIDERMAELEEQTKKAVDLAQQAIDETLAGNLQKQIDENKSSIKQNSKDIAANSKLDDERWDSISQKTDGNWTWREYPDGTVDMFCTKTWNTPGATTTVQEFVYPFALSSAKVVGLALETTWVDSVFVSVGSQSNTGCVIYKYLSVSGAGHNDSVTVHVIGKRA